MRYRELKYVSENLTVLHHTKITPNKIKIDSPKTMWTHQWLLGAIELRCRVLEGMGDLRILPNYGPSYLWAICGLLVGFLLAGCFCY